MSNGIKSISSAELMIWLFWDCCLKLLLNEGKNIFSGMCAFMQYSSGGLRISEPTHVLKNEKCIIYRKRHITIGLALPKQEAAFYSCI
jgi:hypothetical protein